MPSCELGKAASIASKHTVCFPAADHRWQQKHTFWVQPATLAESRVTKGNCRSGARTARCRNETSQQKRLLRFIALGYVPGPQSCSDCQAGPRLGLATCVLSLPTSGARSVVTVSRGTARDKGQWGPRASSPSAITLRTPMLPGWRGKGGRCRADRAGGWLLLSQPSFHGSCFN